MKKLLFLFALLCSCATVFADDKPQMKIDISMSGRSDDQVLEPGFTRWDAVGGTAFTVDGVSYTFSVPTGATYSCRLGWNKANITNATNKAQNGRLILDGMTIDPATGAGQLDLTIKGLPVGIHVLRTYHNRWENSANFSGWPINVAVNGTLVHAKKTTTFETAIANNVLILTTPIEIKTAGESVKVSFYTLAEEEPDNVAEKAYKNMAPIVDAIELNTVDLTTQAKEPSPTSGDIHVDADDGTVQLKWSPAGKSVIKHNLYVATSSAEVEAMTVPTAELTDTTYTLTDLYSMNTYYWRVDEVDSIGYVAKGATWKFRPRQLAFPGAEGYGRFAQGGRGGMVYHVTNLSNDLKPGSFIYGLTQLHVPRTIVFDVSGIITMTDTVGQAYLQDMPSVFADSYLTIAAQTAPGKGICLRYCNLGIGAESIVRHLRAKRGYGATGNALGLNSDESIIDHTTAAWGTDETFSTRGAKMITFQYSMIAEALGIADHKNYPAGTNHGYAATIDGKIGTYSHNMLANCEGRNWSMGGGMDGTNTAIGQMDIFNNVCYNWNGRTTDGGCHEVNFVNNYYKMGPDTKKTILFSQDYENIGSIQSTWQAYISGNIRENKNHTLTTDALNNTYRYTLSNGATDPNTRTDGYGYKTFVTQPFFPSYAEIHSAKDAFKIVTSTSGATMPCRDNQHQRVMREAITGTYTYVGSKSGIRGEIDRETDCGGFEVYPEEARPASFDTDQDGMPDWWEELTGSQPSLADNNLDPDHDGWTLLEDYLDFMAHPYVTVSAGGTATFNAMQEFRGFTNKPVFTIATVPATVPAASPAVSTVGFDASVADSIITVSGMANGIGTILMTVKDGDGTTYTQRLGVAVTDKAPKTGDINHDGKVDIADVKDIVTVICGTAIPGEATDVNADGDVDVKDVNAEISIIKQ